MFDLRAFVQELRDKDDIVSIDEPLSPIYEVSAYLKQLDSGPAVIFNNIKGYNHLVVGGICGTRTRISHALGIRPEQFYERLLGAIDHPKTAAVVSDGPVMEVQTAPALSKVPFLTHFGKDPGPYITAGIVYARTPDGTVENVSFHRILVLGDDKATLRIVPRHLYRICQEAKSRASSVDISISLGLHPALMMAASTSAPYGVSEFNVANALMDGALKLVKCPHVDALAPSDAELVIEGRLLLNETALEGPFVDLTGTYDIQRQQPVIQIVGMMFRHDYLYQGLLPSGSEHRLLMGMPREANIWKAVQGIVPTVRGVNLTLGGSGWLHCVVSLKKFRDGDPKNILMAVFSAHPSLKHAVIVDDDIDPFNMEMVEWAVATRFRGDEDLLVIPRVRVSSLDPASDQESELGCKVGIDATRPMTKPAEKFEKAQIPVEPKTRPSEKRKD